MILVTGGTGFIGKALVRSLNDAGWPLRLLIRPSPKSPDLPKGIPVEIAVSSLNDERGLRAAMVGVDTVFHLAGVERRGAYADITEVDIQGTRAVVDAAVDAGVDRFLTVSHLGADRASAYPVLKAKAISEEYIRTSQLDYTILRSAVVFGANDGFTTALARILSALPFIFLIPGDGQTLIQPVWVEDLVTCLTWALDDDETRNQTYEIGGPEYIPFAEVVNMVMSATGIQRRVLLMRPPYLRGITVMLESLIPGLPVSVYWIDYLATNRTCGLDTIPRVFNLMPARLPQSLGYLEGKNWRSSLWQSITRRRRDIR